MCRTFITRIATDGSRIDAIPRHALRSHPARTRRDDTAERRLPAPRTSAGDLRLPSAFRLPPCGVGYTRLMRRMIKSMIALFVVLAVPIQGFASAAMTHCDQSHRRSQVALVDSDDQPSASHHLAVGGTKAPHHHDAVAVDRANTSSAASQDHAPAVKLSDLAKFKCSACATCCSASVLPSVMPGIAAPDVSRATGATDAPDVDAVAVNGPDRPPRNALA